MKYLQDKATDPKSHCSFILNEEFAKILSDPETLKTINEQYKDKFPANQDLLGITVKGSEIKITGFQHADIKK